jgi:hypothetical protein
MLKSTKIVVIDEYYVVINLFNLNYLLLVQVLIVVHCCIGLPSFSSYSSAVFYVIIVRNTHVKYGFTFPCL